MLKKIIQYLESLRAKSKDFVLPGKATICPGNICSFRCPLCPSGRRLSGRPSGLMDMKTFKRVIDQIGLFLHSMDLYNWGEPLENPLLPNFIYYAKQVNPAIAITVSSHLNNLTDEMAAGLASAGLDELIISLDGASEETYQIYRQGGSYNQVINNIIKMKQFSKGDSLSPRLLWRFLVFRHNQHEVDTARRMAASLEVEFEVARIRTDMALEPLEPVEKAVERDGHWIPTIEEYSAYNLTEKRRKSEIFCRRLWEELTVNWDGSISPCCAIWQREYDFGNLADGDILTVYNNEKFLSARRELLGLPNRIRTVCHICKKNSYLHF